MPLEAIGKEIDLVIEADVPSLLPMLSDDQRESIMGLLKLKANRMYLWLYIILDLLESRVATLLDDEEIKGLVGSLPSTIHEAYAAILKQNHAHAKARSILQLIVAAR